MLTSNKRVQHISQHLNLGCFRGGPSRGRVSQDLGRLDEKEADQQLNQSLVVRILRGFRRKNVTTHKYPQMFYRKKWVH
jgi:hypothetical protein